MYEEKMPFLANLLLFAKPLLKTWRPLNILFSTISVIYFKFAKLWFFEWLEQALAFLGAGLRKIT